MTEARKTGIAVFVPILAAVILTRVTAINPLWAWLATFNAAAFLAFGVDKLTARAGWMRIPEMSLLALALCGGWPAAFLASRLFRHKTIKPTFQRAFWTIAVLQLILVMLVFAIRVMEPSRA